MSGSTPETPSGHVLLATVLTYYGVTGITQDLINRAWETRAASFIWVVPTDAELSWLEETTDVVVSVRDQYGQPLAAPWASPPYTAEISFFYGTGTWGSATPLVPYLLPFSLGADHAHVTYTRNKLVTEHSPRLMANLTGDSPVIGLGAITLLDVGGLTLY